MQQLSGLDASFLYTERSHAPTHITAVTLYEPPPGPDALSYASVLSYLDRRLHLARAFRQKAVRVPGDLDHPWWVQDSGFDLEYHVRELALPRPGDWHQFCTQLARLHARPLDLTKPLWELYVVQGLDAVPGVQPGGFGLVLKIHHAAVDGKSGIEMLTAIHTSTPEIVDPAPPESAWQPEADPSPMELSSRAALNALRTPGRAARTMGRLGGALPGAMSLQAQRGRPSAGLAPGTRFSSPVTPHRVVDACFFPFGEVRAMRTLVPGATVNDVALAVVGGALRSYLEAAGELPDGALLAMTPISVRTEAERADLGNQVSAMVVSLATDVADPVERLAAVHASTSGAKEMAEAIGARNLTELSQLAPGLLIGVGSRLTARFARRNATGVVNTVVTNVPGPRDPIYFHGARCLRMFGAGPVVDGMGLINIVGSYDGDFVLSFTACRQVVPDPERYSDAIRQSFEDLSTA